MAKNIIPTKRVKIGVSEFSTPASELLNPVSATANKIAGTRLAIVPYIRIIFHFALNTLLILLIANGNRIINVNPTRSVPTCDELKAISPFLIRINELPQTNERNRSIRICPVLELK
jgi:hypothetical protein